MRDRETALAETTVMLYALNPQIQGWNGDPFELHEVPDQYHAKLARRQALALLDNGLLAVEPEHKTDNWQSRKCWLNDDKNCLGCGCSCHVFQMELAHDSPI